MVDQATAHQLLLQIARCPNVPTAQADASHPCHRVVGVQTERSPDERHVPEPWNGSITSAPLLFISSNPSIDPHEVFPAPPWSDADISEFFDERFSKSFQGWCRSSSQGGHRSKRASEVPRPGTRDGQRHFGGQSCLARTMPSPRSSTASQRRTSGLQRRDQCAPQSGFPKYSMHQGPVWLSSSAKMRRLLSEACSASPSPPLTRSMDGGTISSLVHRAQFSRASSPDACLMRPHGVRSKPRSDEERRELHHMRAAVYRPITSPVRTSCHGHIGSSVARCSTLAVGFCAKTDWATWTAPAARFRSCGAAATSEVEFVPALRVLPREERSPTRHSKTLRRRSEQEDPKQGRAPVPGDAEGVLRMLHRDGLLRRATRSSPIRSSNT